jgi:hypothetical protein
MAKTGNFYHSSAVTGDVTLIGNSFNKAKFHLHNLLEAETIDTSGSFLNKVEGFYVHVKTIAGGSATPTITARLCCDSDGDLTFFPDTAGQLAIGLTTATSGFAAFEFKLPFKHFANTDQVYLFIKIDQGTCTLANSYIVWSE